MPLLRFDQVVKNYDAVRALNQLTLDVDAGQFVALMGPSGCGKSTLLNLGGAMDFPTSGTVSIDGVATSGMDDDSLTRLRRHKVGFVFQSFQLLQHLTAVENVELPLQLARASDTQRQALDRLDRVGLADLAGRYPHQLSGGQMQRVAIARALVHRPKLILADEPTGNLDSVSGTQILELLRQIVVQDQAAVLMATHSAESSAYADLTIHMRDGAIREVVRK